MTAADAAVCALDAAEAGARLGKLSAILVDAVAHRAPVNFMAGCTDDEVQAFWRAQLPDLGAYKVLGLHRHPTAASNP